MYDKCGTARLLADPCDTGELENYLVENDITWRPDPGVSWTENLIEFCGRICYWSFDQDGFKNKNISKIREGNAPYLGNVIASGHGSVLEHGGPLVILFENVSRVFTHELVRHRAGTAFSQTSGRYVRLDEIPFWIPDCVPEEARPIFEETIKYLEQQQKRLEEAVDIDAGDFSRKKILTSALRRLGPTGVLNNIVMSCNHRAMRHILTMRTDPAAEEEMRRVFIPLARELKERFPSIYQDMEVSVENGCVFGTRKV